MANKQNHRFKEKNYYNIKKNKQNIVNKVKNNEKKCKTYKQVDKQKSYKSVCKFNGIFVSIRQIK